MSDERYDPTWVVDLARRQYPDDRRLHDALASCTRVVRRCDCGCDTPYFAEPSPDSMGEDSDFGMRIALQREGGHKIVVDLLPDGRVACIEG